MSALVGLLTTYLVALMFHGDEYSLAVDGVLGNIVLVLPSLICLVRAVMVPVQRLAFA